MNKSLELTFKEKLIEHQFVYFIKHLNYKIRKSADRLMDFMQCSWDFCAKYKILPTLV